MASTLAVEHAVALAELERSLGDRWLPLIDHGRQMTGDEIVDLACDELAIPITT